MILREKELRNILIFCIFLITSNHDIASASNLLYWGVLAGFPLLLIMMACYRGRAVSLNNFAIWLFAFLGICGISYVYSIDADMSFEVLKGLMVNTLVVLSIMWNIRSVDDVTSIIKIILWVSFVNAIYLFITVDWSAVGTDRLGTDYTGRGWNANTIGMMAVWGMLFIIYLAKTCGLKKYYLGILLLLPLLVYSGSRKAWVSAMGVVVAFALINNKKHVFRAMLIAGVSAYVLYYLMINVPMLYEIGGHRLETLVQGLLGDSQMDTSAERRMAFIEYGILWFKERPFFGYGVHTYAHLLGASDFRMRTYSHNNYVELLVGVGLVGTLIFYSMYAYVLISLLKKFFWQRRLGLRQETATILFLALLIITLAMQYGMVMYTNSLYITLLLLPYLYLELSRRETKTNPV